MPATVIDASLSASWCFPDERNDYGKGVLEVVSTPVEALVPRLWGYEIRNCVLMGLRRKRITHEVFRLAERTGLSVYDAAYLDLALRENLPIATLDKALVKAAVQFGVSVFKL